MELYSEFSRYLSAIGLALVAVLFLAAWLNNRRGEIAAACAGFAFIAIATALRIHYPKYETEVAPSFDIEDPASFSLMVEKMTPIGGIAAEIFLLLGFALALVGVARILYRSAT